MELLHTGLPSLPGLPALPTATEASYVEHLRRPDLSVGTYVIPAGGSDLQEPHTEDEVYVVTAGSARLTTPTRSLEVTAGSVIFVPAGEAHHFEDIGEQLVLLVIFGPAEETRRATG